MPSFSEMIDHQDKVVVLFMFANAYNIAVDCQQYIPTGCTGMIVLTRPVFGAF